MQVNDEVRPARIDAGQCETMWGLGERYHMRLGPEHTGGAFQLTEVMCLPGGGPPPHIHRHEDEAFYVLEGEMEFLLGERIVTASAGQFAWAPRGQVHQFRVPGARPARFLVWVGPGNLDAMFRAFGTPCEPDSMTPPPVNPALLEKVLGAARDFGIEIVADAVGKSREAISPVQGLWVLGVHVSLLGTGETTDGRLCVAEVRVPKGHGPPPHFHVEQSETFHVVEGAIEFQVGQDTKRAGAGTTVFIPAGTVHAFRGIGPGMARLLSIHSPAGMEGFFRECGVEGSADQMPDPPKPPADPQAMIEMLGRHGMGVP